MNKDQKKKIKQEYLDNKFDKRTKEDFEQGYKDSSADYAYYIKRKSDKSK